MEKTLIITPSRCTACRTCELACSFKHAGKHGPGIPRLDQLGGHSYRGTGLFPQGSRWMFPFDDELTRMVDLQKVGCAVSRQLRLQLLFWPHQDNLYLFVANTLHSSSDHFCRGIISAHGINGNAYSSISCQLASFADPH